LNFNNDQLPDIFFLLPTGGLTNCFLNKGGLKFEETLQIKAQFKGGKVAFNTGVTTVDIKIIDGWLDIYVLLTRFRGPDVTDVFSK